MNLVNWMNNLLLSKYLSGSFQIGIYLVNNKYIVIDCLSLTFYGKLHLKKNYILISQFFFLIYEFN